MEDSSHQEMDHNNAIFISSDSSDVEKDWGLMSEEEKKNNEKSSSNEDNKDTNI